MKEIEIRSIISDDDKQVIISAVESVGFVLKNKSVQHDIIFDTEDAELFRSGQKIRLRLEDDKQEITYKGDLTKSDKVSRRTEISLPINNSSTEDISNFLEALGYPILFQIKKERLVYQKNDVEVSFDEWPIIGCLMEIEGKETEIKQIARQVAPSYVFSNYRLKTLFADKSNSSGKSLAELIENYQKSTGFNLGKIQLILD